MTDALQAAVQGAGVAMGMAPLVWASDIADKLVAPFDIELASEYGYYLVHRPEDAAKPGIKAFKAWIAGEMATLLAAPRRTVGTG